MEETKSRDQEIMELGYRPIHLDGEESDRYSIDCVGNIWDSKKNSYVKQRLGTTGYYIVDLVSNDGHKRYIRKVHRLVGMEFVPNDNPEVNNTIDHIDCNKLNNYYRNLEWVTQHENVRRAIQNGRWENAAVYRLGTDRPNTVHTEEEIHKVCKLLEEGYTPREIHEMLGVPRLLSSQIIRGDSWTHISSQYNIPKVNETRFRPKNYPTATVHEACRMLEQGISDHVIAEKLHLPSVYVAQIRRGWYLPEISKQYNIDRARKVVRAPEEDIRKACEYMSRGMHPKQIHELIPTVSVSTMLEIRLGKTYHEISKDFTFPRIGRSSVKPYRSRVIELWNVGKNPDEIMHELEMENNKSNRRYIYRVVKEDRDRA